MAPLDFKERARRKQLTQVIKKSTAFQGYLTDSCVSSIPEFLNWEPYDPPKSPRDIPRWTQLKIT